MIIAPASDKNNKEFDLLIANHSSPGVELTCHDKMVDRK
jgi:hypothetical protein